MSAASLETHPLVLEHTRKSLSLFFKLYIIYWSDVVGDSFSGDSDTDSVNSVTVLV